MLAVFASVAIGREYDEYEAGAPHPEFELPRVGGGSGKLSDFRGKKLLLFNFASW